MTRELSEAIQEIVEIIEERRAKLREAEKNLESITEQVTSGRLSICSVDTLNRIQLHHNREVCSTEDALEVVKDLADDGHVEEAWSNENNTCYYFNIDRIEFCILLDK